MNELHTLLTREFTIQDIFMLQMPLWTIPVGIIVLTIFVMGIHNAIHLIFSSHSCATKSMPDPCDKNVNHGFEPQSNK